jgi:hypothetical protein
MAARNVADGIRHRQQGKSKGQRHTGEPDSKLREAGGENRASATTEHQPEGPEELHSTPLS